MEEWNKCCTPNRAWHAVDASVSTRLLIPTLAPRGGYGGADPDVGAVPAAQILSMISAWIASNPDADELAQLVDGLQAIMQDDGGDGELQIRHLPNGNDQGLPANNLQTLDRGRGRRSALDAQIALDEISARKRRIAKANADTPDFGQDGPI